MRKHTLLAIAVLVGVVGISAEAAPGDLLRVYANPTGQEGTYFGWSLAVVGQDILVGSARETVYRLDSTTGEVLKTYKNPNPVPSEQFSYSIAVSGSDIFVGAPFKDSSGIVYMLNGDTGGLVRTFQSPSGGSLFGNSLATLGGNVLVGQESGSGAVYLFDKDSGELLQTYRNSEPDGTEHFGHSVAGLGSNVLVGAPYDDNGAGVAYLLDGPSGAILNTFHNTATYFGWALASMTEDFAASSHTYEAAYLTDSVTGDTLLTFLNPMSQPSEQFGFAVAALGNNVLVGAPYRQNGLGMVYLFEGIPEPATLGLMLIGGLALLRWRK